jgi:hypothetical protein
MPRSKGIKRASLRLKIFLVLMSTLILVFIGWLIQLGHSDRVFSLLDELMKYGLGAIGGSGLTVIYYQSRLRNTD